MIKHIKRGSNLAAALKSEVLDTHTFESRASRERILYSQGETERLNSPKSVVSLFDEIRRVGKASGIKSQSFLKIDIKLDEVFTTLMNC